MKPILPYSILLSIAISPLALATEYTTQILNVNGIVPNDGVVNVTASTTTGIGAVQVTANGKNTTLQGNVTVTNTGVNGYGFYLSTGSAIVSSINVNNVTSDVNIITNGSGAGYGIRHNGNGASNASKITVDAGSDYDLNIKKSGTSNSTAGFGVQATNNGKIDITAKNVTVDYSSSGDSYGVVAWYSSTINITAEKVTAKAGTIGVVADNGGVINITGKLDASTTRTADGYGVLAKGNNNAATAVTVSGHTTVSGKAQYGVRADTKGTLTLKGGLTVNQATLGATVAVYAYGGTVKDNIANGTGGTKYDISGRMLAETYSGYGVGTIDLHMGADSIFTGYTTKVAAADVINLELSNGANWTTATANSTMTKLSLLSGASINFAKVSDTSFRNINAASASLAAGTILQIDLSAATVANIEAGGTHSVTLFTGLGTLWDNQGALLLNADKTKQFTYTNPTKGVFLINGVEDYVIPEPTTASLTLLGLASLMMRRRRLTV